jgi:hypothetical protein
MMDFQNNWKVGALAVAAIILAVVIITPQTTGQGAWRSHQDIINAINAGVEQILMAISNTKNDIGITKAVVTDNEEFVVPDGTSREFTILAPAAGTTYGGHASLDVVVDGDMTYRVVCLATDAEIELAIEDWSNRNVNVDFSCQSLFVEGFNRGTGGIDGHFEIFGVTQYVETKNVIVQ